MTSKLVQSVGLSTMRMPCIMLPRLRCIKNCFHLSQDRALGVVQIAQQLAACGAAMAAAAQTPGDGAGVHLIGGAHADFIASAGLLAQGQAHLHALNADGQAGQLFQIRRVHPALLDLIPRQVDQGAAAVQMIFQMVPGDPLGLHPLPGLGVEEQGVQLLHMGPGLHQLCRHDVGVGRGGRELEAAGVRGQAGVQAVGDVGVISTPMAQITSYSSSAAAARCRPAG